MMITVTIETPLQDDVRKLVQELNDYLNPLSPKEFQFQMTVEQMADPATTLFVARDENGRAVGLGALKVASRAVRNSTNSSRERPAGSCLLSAFWAATVVW